MDFNDTCTLRINLAGSATQFDDIVTSEVTRTQYLVIPTNDGLQSEGITPSIGAVPLAQGCRNVLLVPDSEIRLSHPQSTRRMTDVGS